MSSAQKPPQSHELHPLTGSRTDDLAASIAPATTSDPSRGGPTARGIDSLGFVMDVPVELTVELGRKRVKISDVLRLGPGSVLELSKVNGEPLDILVNDRLVARAEAVVVGERYGVRITEVLVGDETRNTSEER